MGWKQRLKQFNEAEKDKAIAEEEKMHPFLWKKNFEVTLRKPLDETLKRILRRDHETLTVTSSNFNDILASAEIFNPGFKDHILKTLKEKKLNESQKK